MGAWLNLDHQPETNKNFVSHWTVEMDTIVQITTVSWRHWGHVMIPVRLFRPENGASLSSSPSDEPALISNSLRQVSQRTWRHDRTRGFLYLPRQWGQWTPPNSELCSPTADSSSIPSPSKAERSPKRPKSSSPSSALKSSSPSVPDILQNWTKRNQTEHRCRRAVHLPFFRLSYLAEFTTVREYCGWIQRVKSYRQKRQQRQTFETRRNAATFSSAEATRASYDNKKWRDFDE